MSQLGRFIGFEAAVKIVCERGDGAQFDELVDLARPIAIDQFEAFPLGG